MGKIQSAFKEELDEVPPVFGITRPAQTWNPIRINFQHLGLLISDAWRAKNWKDKLTIWFKPTGWRPENFEEKYPVTKISDVYHFEKYGTQHSKKLMYWSIFQALVTLLLITYMYDSIGTIGLPHVFVYGAFIFVTVYSYTELMDARKTAVFWEAFRFLFAMGLLYFYGDWFGLSNLLPVSTFILIGYFSISLAMSIYFVAVDFEKEKIALA